MDAEKLEENACNTTYVDIKQEGHNLNGITEDIRPVQPWRRRDLFLEIPSRKLTGSCEDVRIDMPLTSSPTPRRAGHPLTPGSSSKKNGCLGPSSSKGKSSRKGLLPRLSFNFQDTSSEVENTATLTPLGTHRKPFMRSFYFTSIFTPRMRRTSSLPVTPVLAPYSESVPEGVTINPLYSSKREGQRYIPRSLSVPANKGRRMRRMDSSAGKFRVIPTTPQVVKRSSIVLDITSAVNIDNNDVDGEDILEDEAICRICFIELGEGGENLKLECNCKGDLALAHQECAIKWFTIKGNKNCDVCNQEVQNLPVTLLRIPDVHSPNRNRIQQTAAQRIRVWQEVPILVIMSMLAYFCVLEQLLVSKMGTSAVAISLPFSCILGLLASMISSTMVERKFVWIYSFIQFVLVILFAHLFYSLLQVQAIMSIILSTFTGLGVMMSLSSLFYEFMSWRRMLHAWSENHRGSRETPVEDQLPEGSSPPQAGSSILLRYGNTPMNTPREL